VCVGGYFPPKHGDKHTSGKKLQNHFGNSKYLTMFGGEVHKCQTQFNQSHNHSAKKY
jgi:hypothetical protein